MMRAEHFTVLRRKPVEVKHTMSRIKIQYHCQLIESLLYSVLFHFNQHLWIPLKTFFFFIIFEKNSVHFWGYCCIKGHFCCNYGLVYEKCMIMNAPLVKYLSVMSILGKPMVQKFVLLFLFRDMTLASLLQIRTQSRCINTSWLTLSFTSWRKQTKKLVL